MTFTWLKIRRWAEAQALPLGPFSRRPVDKPSATRRYRSPFLPGYWPRGHPAAKLVSYRLQTPGGKGLALHAALEEDPNDHIAPGLGERGQRVWGQLTPYLCGRRFPLRGGQPQNSRWPSSGYLFAPPPPPPPKPQMTRKYSQNL